MAEKRIAVFPGSFDPVTKGHESILRRGSPLFDECIVAIGINSRKKPLYPLDQRTKWLEDLFRDEGRIRVEHFDGLTVDFCRHVGANYILRGLRDPGDFEYERRIAQMNRDLDPSIETVLLPALPQHSAISSTIVREIVLNNGDAAPFVPENVTLFKPNDR